MPKDTSRLAGFFLPVMEQARAGLNGIAIADAATLGGELTASLDSACAQALKHGHNAEDVDNALFAVVAWLDEKAMTVQWSGASAWRLAPLQRHYFSTTRAGSEFYQRLAALPESNATVREMYSLALISGFRGEYGTRPATQFSAFIRQTIEQTQAQGNLADLGGGQPVFPGALPGRDLEQNNGGFRQQPAMSLLLLLGLPLLVVLLVFLYLDFSLSQTVSTLINRS